MKSKNQIVAALAFCCGAFALTSSALAQGTAFTYQGLLNDGGAPANGSYDLKFTLFSTNNTGNPIAGPVTNLATSVSDGLFTALIDFGIAPPNGTNWLEIAVRTNGAAAFSPGLAPRQQLTPVPYAISSQSAETAQTAQSAQTAQTAQSAQNITGQIGSGNLSGPYTNALSFGNASNSFAGNGSNLTSLNASQLTSGTVSDARLSSNVALRVGGNVFAGNQTVTNGSIAIGPFAPDRPLAITSVGATREWLSLKDTNGSTIWHLNSRLGGVNFAQSGVADGRLFLGATGNIGIGTLTPDASLTIAGLTNQFPVALHILPSTHATSRRAGLSLDNWAFIQDTAGVGAKDFGIFDSASGQSRLYIATNGNVGLGTTSPTNALQVNGVVSASGFSGAGSGLTNLSAAQLVTGVLPEARLSTNVALLNASQTFTADQTVQGQVIAAGNLGAFSLQDRSNPASGHAWQWRADSTGLNATYFGGGGAFGQQDLTLGTNGNVGIGTTSPQASLEVVSSGGRSFAMSGPAGGVFSFYDTGASHFLWDISGHSDSFSISRSGIDYPFLIDYGSGDVGIDLGNSLPQASLDVGGSAHFNGNVGVGTFTPTVSLEVAANNGPAAAQFDVSNCGGPCAQSDYQEGIRLWNQNPNGQVGLGFSVGGGPISAGFSSGVWIGTHYGASGQDNDFKIATRGPTGNLTDRVYVQGSTGAVGIGTSTPSSDAILQVKGMVRMGSETGTTEPPNRSIVTRRINSSSMTPGTVVARVSDAFTLERDGSPGGLIVKITANSGGPVIAATGVDANGNPINFYQSVFGGGGGIYPVIQDFQQVGYCRITFGDPGNSGDMTEVVLTRFVGGGNDDPTWVGYMTTTFNQ